MTTAQEDPSGSSQPAPGTGSNPPQPRPPSAAGEGQTPATDGRRRLELTVDRHFELRLYMSPKLLRWTTSAFGAAISLAWYVFTH